MTDMLNETYVEEIDQSDDKEEGSEDFLPTSVTWKAPLSGPFPRAEGQDGDDHSSRHCSSTKRGEWFSISVNESIFLCICLIMFGSDTLAASSPGLHSRTPVVLES